jgi:hypothetical protein
MKQVIGYIVLLFVLFQGCKYSNDVHRVKKDYQENVLVHFDSKYLDHFPKKIEYLPIKYLVDTTNYYDHPRLILSCHYPLQVIDTLISFYSKESMAVYSAGQSNLLITNRFTSPKNWSKGHKGSSREIAKYTNDRDYVGLYPIPNFWDLGFEGEFSDCRLPLDFELYVVEAKSGLFFSESYHTDGKYMPLSWKNGYSKGVAISKERKSVIYWFIIW